MSTAPDPVDAALATGAAAARDMIRRAVPILIVLAVVLPALLIVRTTTLWPAALSVAALFGGLAVLMIVGGRRQQVRGARVRAVVRERPDEVAEIAHRPGGQPGRPSYGSYYLVSIVLRDGTSMILRVEPEHRAALVALLQARCTAAVVHEGNPSRTLRNGPVARVVARK